VPPLRDRARGRFEDRVARRAWERRQRQSGEHVIHFRDAALDQEVAELRRVAEDDVHVGRLAEPVAEPTAQGRVEFDDDEFRVGVGLP